VEDAEAGEGEGEAGENMTTEAKKEQACDCGFWERNLVAHGPDCAVTRHINPPTPESEATCPTCKSDNEPRTFTEGELSYLCVDWWHPECRPPATEKATCDCGADIHKPDGDCVILPARPTENAEWEIVLDDLYENVNRAAMHYHEAENLDMQRFYKLRTAVRKALDEREADTCAFVLAAYIQAADEKEFKGWLRNIVRSKQPEMARARRNDGD